MKNRGTQQLPALIRVLGILGLVVGVLALLVPPALAERMQSDSYVIQFGNFNSTSGTKSSASYNLTDTVGQTASGPYGTYGSTTFIGGGFQYIYQIQDFSFQISKNAIDFGVLTPDTFATDSHTLTITTRGAGGYAIYAYEQQPLSHHQGSYTIPNTSCDSSCTISTADIWTTPTNYGFGFNMTGDDIPADFVDATYFRPFADASSAQAMQVVMSSNDLATAQESTVTYKVTTGGSQAAGQYTTSVVYVAVPGY